MELRGLAVAAALTLSTAVSAQVPDRPPRQNPPAAARAGREVVDTAAKPDSTKTFAPPDSVMAALLARQGYTITRYQGDVVTFDALTKALAIAASAAHQAMVEREGLKVTTDSVIVYHDDRQNVNVQGRYEIVPGQGQSPIGGSGNVQYDVARRSGRLTNATVTVEESGQRWFIKSAIGTSVLGDSARAIPPRFYGLGGSLTSCEEEEPDYHFRMREIKRTEKTLVARPAVLFIKDVPVMWLPFVFQDIRPGRRSGILPPRIGTSDIIRNNPGYRRHIENIGYYWALSDYVDMAMWGNWRSSAGGNDAFDPGFYELNGEWKYNWLSRFLSGQFATSYQKERTGDSRYSLSWFHNQRLGRERNFNTQLNYTSNTRLQRQNTFNPYAAMATIRSNFTYSDKIGPASLSVGGSQIQYSGREQIDRTLPTVTVSVPTVSAGQWLAWTPSFSYTESMVFHDDRATTFSTRFVPGSNGQLVRADSITKNSYDRNIRFGSPLRIFGMDFSNDVAIRDVFFDYPEEDRVFPDADSTRTETRVFAQRYRTDIDWNPSFSLPPVLQRFKVSPSISLQNTDGSRPFWVRTHVSGGEFVHQSKRLTYGLSASPTIYGLLPGFGPFARFRHQISPSVSYAYAPAKTVSNEFLEAVGQIRQGYLGALAQNAVSLTLSQNIEAKVRPTGDSTLDSRKLKVLSMQLTPLSYDFERARKTGRRLSGVTSEQLGTSLRSDLLPGFDLNFNYSLFEGSTQTDTARFDPFLTTVSSRISFSKSENPFTVLTRLFGRAVPDQSPDPQAATTGTEREAAMAREFASQPVAGQASRGNQFMVPPTTGWDASFNFSTSRSRPLRGDGVIVMNNEIRCEGLRLNPFAYEDCLRSPTFVQPPDQLTGGGPVYQTPRQSSLAADMRFALTQKWSASWNTSFDFEEHEFASHIVSLQRDLHDWRAIFAFTHSPNGNFAFNFFIALKPQPELKFDYSRATIRSR